jgi:3-O-methylgallate 3,4-dioxygenase
VADISLGIGTSHAPQLGTPPDQWDQRATADRANSSLAFRGKDYPYEELRALRQSAFAADCEPDVWRARHSASRAAIAALGRAIHGAELDVLVIVSSDHKETFSDELLPQFAVYWGDSVQHVPLTQEALDAFPPGLAIAEVGNYPMEETTRACHPELAAHLIKETSRAGFDPAASRELPAGAYDDRGIPHGWGFVMQQVLGGENVPAIVPVFVNTFYEPNPPSAQRCYEFGRALGAAIRTFPADLKVGVVASGGLSHFVIDEELDRGFIHALAAKDAGFITAFDAKVLRSGTSEYRNWIVVAGALEEAALDAHCVDYQPCYRSEAGTGCGMAFVIWDNASVTQPA